MELLPRSSHVRTGSRSELRFFSVSLVKFAVMSLMTLGIYEQYWAYRNWVLIKERERSAIMPFWRGFFLLVWIYPLLIRIRDAEEGAEPRPKKTLQVIPVVVAYMLITLLYNLRGPLWMISLLSFVPLLPVQSRVNRLNATSGRTVPANDRFTLANWGWMILGGLSLVAWAFVFHAVSRNQS